MPEPRSYSGRLWLLVAVVAALCALRFVHLGADTPRELTTWSVGVFVDEGYKALESRNQVLFGARRWSEADDYPGWRGASPLTTGPTWLAFHLFGHGLAQVRAITVVWFAGLLAWFAFGLRRRYTTGLVLLGLVLLGTQHTLFFFSRLGLQEVPVVLCLYGALFLLARSEPPSGAAIGATLVLCAVATFGIKRSAPAYFLFVALGLLAASPALWSTAVTREVVLRASLLLALLATCVWVFRSSRLPELDVGGAVLVDNLLSSTLMHSTAPLMAVALFCAFHALLVCPRRLVQSPYRAGLLALVLLAPILMTVFHYRPLRYYVPILPAYVLLVVEWLHLRPWELPFPHRTRPLALAVLLPTLAWALFCMGRSVHRYVLQPFVPTWGLPEGLPREALVMALLMLGLGMWQFRRELLTGRAALVIVVATLGLSSARDLLFVGSFFAAPQYEARDIAAELERILPPAAVVGGDWAPMLTFESSLRSLYMNPEVNRPERVHELRPDYLMVDSWDPRPHFEARAVRFAPAVLEATYANRPVRVYPIVYGRPRPTPPAAPGPSDGVRR
jgi:hypothetical protein